MHRKDVFAEQQSSGAYYPVKRELTEVEVQEHLAGVASYGVYVIEPVKRGPNGGPSLENGTPLETEANTVKYVVFDLDTKDPYALDALKEGVNLLVGVKPDHGSTRQRALLLERSGNKGWHVWLFLDSPLPARQVRAWAKVEKWNHLWPLEIFPKQDTVDAGGFGNLVKLPLGKHTVSGNWSEFVPVPGWATGIEDVVPLPSSLVPQPPVASPSGSREGRGASRTGGIGATTPFPCVTRIVNEGLDRGVRDLGFFQMALYCYSHGLPEDMALDWCLRVNDLGDPLPEREVRTKVKSAYTGRYEGARCGNDWLRDFCPAAGTPECKGWSVSKGMVKDERFAYLDA